MKKFKILLLPLIASATMLTACSSAQPNQGPELRGVTDITCLVNTEVDLLDGVAALDEEDGDITPDLHIFVTPEIEVNGGLAIFPAAGEYEVCYEIRDSLGKLARTTAYATVTEREVFMANVTTNGFSLLTGGGVKVLSDGLSGSEYRFKVSGNEIAEDVKLSRTYTLVSGEEYTFRYYFNSNISGKIAVAADGSALAERTISEGENTVEFTHTLPQTHTSDGQTASETVQIELWLGGLDGDIDFAFYGAETEYFQNAAGYEKIVDNLDFNGNIINRDDMAHAVYTSDDGKSATLEVTEPTGEIWQVGMFINVGVRLEEGGEYIISFDIQSELGNPYEVCIQHDQWQDSDAIILNTPQGGIVQTVNATSTYNGNLWLFVRSGVYQNKITISNLTVQQKQGGYKYGAYRISGFTSDNYDGGAGNVESENGKAVYNIQSFGTDWGNNELASPAFTLSGSAGNFVVTFKAKATQNLSVVFAGTLSDYWDTFVWKQLKITTEEQIYSVRCDDKGVEGLYKFVWQFGSADNAVYSDVTVEISDIKICYLSDMEK